MIVKLLLRMRCTLMLNVNISSTLGKIFGLVDAACTRCLVDMHSFSQQWGKI